MKSIGRTMRNGLMLGLLASCLGAGLANAEEITGKFTLPFDTQWSVATLKAGDYSFRLERGLPTGMLRLYRGNEAVAMVYAMSYRRKAMEGDALLVNESNGAPEVREMRLGSAGVILYYGPHKPKHGSATEEQQIGQLLPMVSSGAAN
ncbi:MAG: hypothetical protein U0Q18_31260 [Bryobacteraceae bacterium]